MTDGVDGETWFTRCSGCWEPYVVVETTNPYSGAEKVVWGKPKVKRAAYSCTHEAPPEQWNGIDWEQVACK